MNESQKKDPRRWVIWRLSGAVRQKSYFHQLGSGISLPADVALLRRVLSADKIKAIYEIVGESRIRKIAAVTHDDPNPDYPAVEKREAKDLKTLRRAITAVTGKESPWIIGFASGFAQTLMDCIKATK